MRKGSLTLVIPVAPPTAGYETSNSMQIEAGALQGPRQTVLEPLLLLKAAAIRGGNTNHDELKGLHEQPSNGLTPIAKYKV